ncbi:MAG TPA: VWA domain-containing protein [Anaerolineae bacterium]|nr:VWA domain-containing protein [Anaerolineae bacterium]
MTEEPDFYEILGVPQNASLDDIKSAYRVLAKQFHPDAQETPAGTSMLFRQVQEAYDVLSDDQRRTAYDRRLGLAGLNLDALFTLNVQLSRTILQVMPEEQILYALFEVKAVRAMSRAQRLPLNLCLVIDRSTSMQGVRLDQVKAAAHQLVDSLQEGDALAVVAFSDRADVVWPSQTVGDTMRAKSRVTGIQAAGGTEILQGLKLGMDELERHRRSQSVNHLILLTDGQTYGDEEKCLEMALEAKRRSVGISAMGIGEDWNDQLLDAIASRSGGASHYIASAADVQAILNERLKSLAAVYGDELRLTPRLSENVRIRGAFRLTPYIQRMDMDGDALLLGTLQADASIAGLFELVVGQQEPGVRRLAQLELTGNVPALERTDQRVQRNISATFTTEPPPGQAVPPHLLNALAKVTIFQMQESAWTSLEKGDVAAATQRLETMATRLLDMGEHQLARAALLEAGRLARSGHLSPGGQKTIKYGTRGLSLAAMKDQKP